VFSYIIILSVKGRFDDFWAQRALTQTKIQT